jgi:hypothetical protein
MSHSSVQVFGYALPTVLPCPAGVVSDRLGAPTVELEDRDAMVRAQRLISAMVWSATTFRPSDKSAKVFVAPEAFFRRFVARRSDPTVFDPAAGLGHYDPGVPASILTALDDAMRRSTQLEGWLLVVGSEAWLDESHGEVASDLMCVGPTFEGLGTPRLLREIVKPAGTTPYTTQDAERGVLPRATVAQPRSVIDSFVRTTAGLVAVESTLGHQQGVLRSNLEGLWAAMGAAGSPGLQVLCSIDRDLDPAEVVAAEGGYVLVNDGMFARDARDRLALSQPPRVALAEVTAYHDSIAQLVEQRPQRVEVLPGPLQLAVPLPGYVAPQRVAAFKSVRLPGGG